jgi:hypothetical protein
MPKSILILFTLIFIFSCKTLNYKFGEKIAKPEKINFDKQIKDSAIKKNAVLTGMYSEKNLSYKFFLDYDLAKSILKLKFTTVLGNDTIFESRLKNDEKYYDSFDNSIFSVKIGLILDAFNYIFDVFPSQYDLYMTNDDYYVLVDKNRNYQKYDEKNRIIKKENLNCIVRYNYSPENDSLTRIEFEKNTIHFYLVFENP